MKTQFTFDEAIKHGRDWCAAHGHQLQNGMPWHFEIHGQPFTHENDNCYIVGMGRKFQRGEIISFEDNGMRIAPEQHPVLAALEAIIRDLEPGKPVYSTPLIRQRLQALRAPLELLCEQAVK